MIPHLNSSSVQSIVILPVIVRLGQVFFMSQCVSQNFLVVGEKPKLGLIFTIAAGLTNMFLDFLLITDSGQSGDLIFCYLFLYSYLE